MSTGKVGVVVVSTIWVGGVRSRSRLRNIVIGLAKRTARSPTGQPGVKTDGMEGMATSQAADVVIILKRIDADSTGITGSLHALRR